VGPFNVSVVDTDEIQQELRSIIHVPALRGNPTRTYKTSAVGGQFPGTFEPYVASIVNHWQTTKDVRLKQLGSALEKLGLTWKVEASRLDDTQVELRVGRLRKGGRGAARDLVSIADVGFGLSQCLPVVVALLAARPGQLVYLEEPEIHLHPRAQVALAQLLADAANRGVRVVAETHSSHLLHGAQSLVAEGALSPDLVALHWFSQTNDGTTEVRSAELDEAGAFGDWPEDFDTVALDAQSRYLDAAEARLAKR
jgi:predicted ATPase